MFHKSDALGVSGTARPPGLEAQGSAHDLRVCSGQTVPRSWAPGRAQPTVTITAA